MKNNCIGDHEIYVADVAGFPALGKLVVITVCRRCAEVQFSTYDSPPGSPMTLKSEKG